MTAPTDVDAIATFYNERAIPLDTSSGSVPVRSSVNSVEACGPLLQSLRGNRFSTLARAGEPMAEHGTDLDVHRVEREEVETHRRDIEIMF